MHFLVYIASYIFLYKFTYQISRFLSILDTEAPSSCVPINSGILIANYASRGIDKLESTDIVEFLQYDGTGYPAHLQPFNNTHVIMSEGNSLGFIDLNKGVLHPIGRLQGLREVSV